MCLPKEVKCQKLGLFRRIILREAVEYKAYHTIQIGLNTPRGCTERLVIFACLSRESKMGSDQSLFGQGNLSFVVILSGSQVVLCQLFQK